MAAIRSLRPRANWGEFCAAFIKTCMPEKIYVAESIDIIMHTYDKNRVKEMTQRRRGTATRNIIIGGADQAMPKYRDWSSILSDGDNKTESIRFIAEFVKTKVSKTHKIPLK